MGYWSSQVTAGGYKLPEVISGLQKHIRRGEEEQAMECAMQIESIQPRYLWNRMKVIASEDIGLADSSIAVLVHALCEQYLDAKSRGSGSTRLFLIHAVFAMCRAPKSRLIDHANIALYRREEGWYEIPDYVFDQHTAEGRRRGRGLDHFWSDGTVLADAVDLPRDDAYREEAIVNLRAGRQPRYAQTHGKREGAKQDEGASRRRPQRDLFSDE